MTRRKALLTATVVLVACGLAGAWLELRYGDPS